MTASLFEPRTLGALALSNAIVMAPMTRDRAGPGDVPGDLLGEYYRQRASAGFIQSGDCLAASLPLGFFKVKGRVRWDQLWVKALYHDINLCACWSGSEAGL